MKRIHSIKYGFLLLLPVLFYAACTKLDTKVYNQIENDNFWKTPDQVAAGIAPVYTQMNDVVGNLYESNEVPTDEIVIPVRGNDWRDGGYHLRMFNHKWSADDLNGIWNAAFSGIGRCNFIMDVVNKLPEKPVNIDAINAELKIMRAYYYLQAIDNFGNVPIVNSFAINPNTVKNSTSREVFDFIEAELKENIPLMTPDVTTATYGRANKWVGFSVLAKLYLNAQVYTGTARWADCAAACDSIILSGKYALSPGYFDNFKYDNSTNNLAENIFVVPEDTKYIGGNQRNRLTLHYNLLKTFGTSGSLYNGWCATGDFYYQNFDTLSNYSTTNGKVYRTFNDQRTGQFIVGQQFTLQYAYPPDKNILFSSNVATDIAYDGTTLLFLQPNFTTIENGPEITAKLFGARNIKYFPEPGNSNGAQSNDLVVYRLADILLMRAECIMRGATAGSTGAAEVLVNAVRTRAYSGDVSNNWTAADITAVNLLAERARELAWESWRRQDLIRFDVADGTHYFDGARSGTRSPAKAADPGTYLRLFPIPQQQYTANNNLVQNPGYPPF